MKYLLDTNIVAEFIAKMPNAQVIDWLNGLDPSDVYLSVITIGELANGVASLLPSKRKGQLERWLTQDVMNQYEGRILEINSDVMLRWGEITAAAERVGKTMPAMDSLIAAIAIHNDCVIVTRNQQDFVESGVQIINPWSEEE